jgi:hypothetical protein
MKIKLNLIFLCLSICSVGFGQDIKFTKISETKLGNGSWEYVYNIELYNDNSTPICIPVSFAFGLTADLSDTVDVSNIYPASDTSLTFSLYYAKSLEGSSTRYPAIPVIINPGTYFITNIRFIKSQRKSTILELKYSADKNLDYYKILSSFGKSPKYMWMDKLNFKDKKYSFF